MLTFVMGQQIIAIITFIINVNWDSIPLQLWSISSKCHKTLMSPIVDLHSQSLGDQCCITRFYIFMFSHSQGQEVEINAPALVVENRTGIRKERLTMAQGEELYKVSNAWRKTAL